MNHKVVGYLYGLLKLSLIVVNRHWLLGLENAVLTVAPCIGVIAGAARIAPNAFSQAGWLRLRLATYFVALYKSAFFLILGDNRHNRLHAYSLWVTGIQLPTPSRIFDPSQYPKDTIWQSTSATEVAFFLLVGYALIRLLARARSYAEAYQAIDALDRVAQLTQATPDTVRVKAALNLAAASIGRPRLTKIRVVVLPYTIGPSPFVLGLFRPVIVIGAEVLTAMSDAELDVALRHELGHVCRGDHWKRWFVLWLYDIAAPTLFAGLLLQKAAQIDEEICDSIAVKRPSDALRLAAAIRVAQVVSRRSRPAAQSRSEIPNLVGIRQNLSFDLIAREGRVARLIKDAHKPAKRPGNSRIPMIVHLAAQIAGFLLRAFVCLLLAIFFLVKVYAYYSVG